MSVLNQQGNQLDLNAAREKLNKDRDTGAVSKRDYKKASKGLNRLIDNERKGISYQFTGQGQYKAVDANGHSISRRDGGVGINDALGISGRQVSKAMGYAQKNDLVVPENIDGRRIATTTSTTPATTGEKPGIRFNGEVESKITNMYNDTSWMNPVANPDETDEQKKARLKEESNDFYRAAATEAINKQNSQPLKVQTTKEDNSKETLDKIAVLEKEMADNKAYYDKFYEWFPNKDIPFGDYYKQRWKNGSLENTSVGKRKERDEAIPKEIAKLDGDLRELGYPRAGKSRQEILTLPLHDDPSNLDADGAPIRTIGDPGIIKYMPSLLSGTAVKGGSYVASKLDDLSSVFPNIGSYAPKVAETVVSKTAPAVSKAGGLNAKIGKVTPYVPKKPVLELAAPLPNAGVTIGKWQPNRVFQGTTSGNARKAMTNADTPGKAIRPEFNSYEAVVKAKEVITNIVTKIKDVGKIRKPSRSKPRIKKLPEQRKVQTFSGGGVLGKAKSHAYGTGNSRFDWKQNSAVANSHVGIMDYTKAKAPTSFEGSSWMGKYKGKPLDFSQRVQQLQLPEITKSFDAKIGGDKKTLDVDSRGWNNAYQTNPKSFDQDKWMNNAMGAYSAISLATAKKPVLEKPKRFNMAIRPAQGDEGMVSRSFNEIDSAVRGGQGQLAQRTGSDLSSYVQGATAMTDNAAKAKAGVLGANAQLKRQDETRMFGEMNQEKQANWSSENQFIQEQNADNRATYAQRVGGANAAVSQSLNYGVQKRADEKNGQTQLTMANRRLDFLLQTEASRMRKAGSTEKEIEEWLETQRNVAQSYSSGGKLSASDRMSIANNKNMAEANKQLRDLFKEYSKLISVASNESIKQFYTNIRSINQRNNITITRR